MGRARCCLRGGALALAATMSVTGLLSPRAATAATEAEWHAPAPAPQVALQAGVTGPHRHPHAHPPAPRGAPTAKTAKTPATGTDAHDNADDAVETRAERNVVLASTWHLDPTLLVRQDTDSPETVAARGELATINARLPEVLEAYDRARARSDGAALRAEVAADDLRKASAVAARARARWQADRALLVSAVVQTYTTSSTEPLDLFVSVDSEDDLLTAMTMLHEVSDTQAAAVQAAERSRDRLRAAARAEAVVLARARDRATAADAALATATAARERVLEQLRTARTLLKESVLADELAAIEARKREEAAAAAARAAAAGAVADGAMVQGAFYRPAGDMSFPLPPGASYVDQDNWGAASDHWSRVHTGDDLSAACGTPVLAVTDGTVLVRTDQSWSGRWLVLVSTGEGRLTTWYAHMQELRVADGAPVRAGQQIGVVGAEGNATGCHLHFEVHPAGGSIYQDNIDPEEWLRAVGLHSGQ